MDSKPIVLTDDHSLVDHDLSNVYAHWLIENPPIIDQQDIKFKKKEQIETLKKSVLKHRIRLLTGKDLPVIETEVGKSFGNDDDLKKLARLLILEAVGKLPNIPKPTVSRKRAFDDAGEVEEPTKKKGRRSLAPTPAATTPKRPARKSMLPQIPIVTRSEPEPMEANEEESEDDLDYTDLGPNPTEQMKELKRKKMQNKTGAGSTSKKAIPVASPSVKKLVPKKVEVPARNEFPGENCSIYLIQANIAEVSLGFLDFAELQKVVGPNFPGAHLTFIHTPVEWSPTDVFAVSMKVKHLNRIANQDIYTIMVGCGIENVNLLVSALKRHTRHVQVIVFERDDMNKNSSSNVLRETTTLFILAYFFPGCDKEGITPSVPMVRPNLTTCFRTKNIEDLENTIIHSFSEEGDWILDICCGRRELSLAAQKSGRNAIAFDGAVENLNELSVKASAIARHHNTKFRPGIDGNILTMM